MWSCLHAVKPVHFLPSAPAVVAAHSYSSGTTAPAGPIMHACCCHQQSYAGGRDLFGLATDPAKLEKRGFQVPIFNDGLLEVRCCGTADDT